MGKFLEALCDELILYVRQIAWLNTAPDPAKGSEVIPVLRREDGREIVLPPCEALYLADHLFRVGPAFGNEALPHSEIEAYQRNTGADLNVWEVLTLRRLSSEYLAEHRLSREADRIAPWTGGQETTTEIQKAEKVRANLRALAGL